MNPAARKVLELLKHRPKEAIEYFSKIALGDSVEIKYGFVEDSLSITFGIKGVRRDQKLSISKKIDQLFETVTDLTRLDEYLPTIKNPEKFYFSPYLKIQDDPLFYVARCTIDHKPID